MSLHAYFFAEKESSIPESKRNEFVHKIEKIFVTGGMMGVEKLPLFGKDIFLLHKVKMKEEGIEAYYNYFEENLWDEAGLYKDRNYLWSNKLGCEEFYKVIVASYVLQELYTDGISTVIAGGEPVIAGEYVGWINYLFNEQHYVNNFDPWKLFEIMHYSNSFDEEYLKWHGFGENINAFIGEFEIYAVINGYKKAIEVYDKKDKEKNEEMVFEKIKETINYIYNYKSNEEYNSNNIQMLIDSIYEYYEKEQIDIKSIRNEYIRLIITNLQFCDAPAFIVKAITEIYSVDFWDTWDKIRHIIKRKNNVLFENNCYFVEPISTEKFLDKSPDDMIPYWEEGYEFEFTDELENWFKTLKKQYDTLVNTAFNVENTFNYMIDLLEKANDNYYYIFSFENFFWETIENFNDKRYQCLWKIFEDMINDSEMKNIGGVIFVPEGSEYENEGVQYRGKQPKRRLRFSWKYMNDNMKKNKARVILRRYMALMGNKKLRYKVFGV